MLTIRLPNGSTSGECRINAQSCVFEIEGGEFRFRPKDDPSAHWDRRTIEHREPGENSIAYLCSNRDGGGTEPIVFRG